MPFAVGVASDAPNVKQSCLPCISEGYRPPPITVPAVFILLAGNWGSVHWRVLTQLEGEATTELRPPQYSFQMVVRGGGLQNGGGAWVLPQALPCYREGHHERKLGLSPDLELPLPLGGLMTN